MGIDGEHHLTRIEEHGVDSGHPPLIFEAEATNPADGVVEGEVDAVWASVDDVKADNKGLLRDLNLSTDRHGV